MADRPLIQIVPRRGAAPDGIRDYAASVAHRLRLRAGVETTFVAGSPLGAAPAADDDWPTVTVETRSAASLERAIAIARDTREDVPILLHVSGYGYAARGAPLWLLDGMKRWRRSARGSRFVCVFHELYATGKPWQSSFWLRPLQKHVARELWRLADAGLTTTGPYHRDLSAWRPDASHVLALMPVPSNVGEPAVVKPYAARPPRAAVFGGAGTVRGLYALPHSEIASWLTALGIREIIDIGPRDTPPPASVAGVPVTPMGSLSAAAVSHILTDCRVGLLAYDVARLGKSTVLAAYGAHGIVPICFGARTERKRPVPVDGQPVLRGGAQPGSADEAEALQETIVEWYKTHTTERLADTLVPLLGIEPTALPADGTLRVPRASAFAGGADA